MSNLPIEVAILASFLSRYQTEIAKGGAAAQMAKARLQLGYMFYTSMATTGYFSGALGGSDIQIPGATTGGKRELMKASNFRIYLFTQLPIAFIFITIENNR